MVVKIIERSKKTGTETCSADVCMMERFWVLLERESGNEKEKTGTSNTRLIDQNVL
jgi:hypothetical protein